MIVYAIDMNDVPLNITVPMMRYSDFKNANIVITNGYQKPKAQIPKPLSMANVYTAPSSVFVPTDSKAYKFLSEDRLRHKLERVLVDNGGQILIPLSDKNKILQCLITLENMFQTNTKLQTGFRESRSGIPPVIYLEHMSRDTLGVGRSHLGWMNFQDNKVF